jgi:hypothetical protein
LFGPDKKSNPVVVSGVEPRTKLDHEAIYPDHGQITSQKALVMTVISETLAMTSLRIRDGLSAALAMTPLRFLPHLTMEP